MALKPGTQLGRYEIEAPLGAGGMGEVYRARDPRLGREVALKVLPPSFSSDTDRLRRFEREARAVAVLNHPNIVAIFDIGTAEGAPYIVSELLQGETLRTRLDRGRLPVTDAVVYASQLASGLAAAHAKGIIHRDLKPENLFLTREGWLKILDFGLAKLAPPVGESLGPTVTLEEGTVPGMLMGTVGYMSPEQVRGQELDHRSDIFALGTIFYEMLSGKRAFHAATAADSLAAILNQNPPSLVGTDPNITPELDRIIRRAVEKSPDERFQSAKEVAVALEALSEVANHRDTTPASERKTVLTGIPEELRRATPKSWWRITSRATSVTALLALVIILALIAANVGSWRDRLLGRTSAGPIQSLAVLPFANLSGDSAQEYFADGMTDAMITQLAQIGSLRVISRTSVMQYKSGNKPLPQIARELHIDGVLEGSVLRSGERVRINAQLVRAVPERHLWAKAYDGNLSDVMAIQSEVARSVAEEIRVKLTSQEESRLQSVRAVNPQAHDAYLRGRYYWNRGEPQDVEKAREYFQQALEKDPLYAPAYAGLADYYSVLPFYTSSRPDEVFSKAKAAASKALELDDSLAEAHASLAYIRTYYDWDWAGAEREFQRAIALNPNDATVRHRYSRYLSSLGRIDEALRQMRRAQELDPLSTIIKANIGVIYYFGRKYDLVIEELRKVLQEDPNFSVAHWGLGLSYEQKGMLTEAIAEFEKADALGKHRSSNTLASLGHAYATAGQKQRARQLLQELENRAKKEPISGYQLALIHIGLGENDAAVAALDKAFRERSTLLSYLKMDPRFDPLHSDPRFHDLRQRIGLPI